MLLRLCVIFTELYSKHCSLEASLISFVISDTP
jgi:hypothetical protein